MSSNGFRSFGLGANIANSFSFFIKVNFIMQINKKLRYVCKKNGKGEFKIDENRIELALEVINIKISEIMKK